MTREAEAGRAGCAVAGRGMWGRPWALCPASRPVASSLPLPASPPPLLPLHCRTGFFLGTNAMGAVAHHLSTSVAPGSAPGKTPFEVLSANASTEIANRLFEGIAM